MEKELTRKSMFNKQLIYFTVAVSLSTLNGCKEEPADPETSAKCGTLKVNIIGKHGTEDFVMYDETQTTENKTYRIEGLKFYVSNTTAGSQVSSDVFLLNFLDNHQAAGSTGESFQITLEEGTFDSFSFKIGLDNETNHEDPSIYAQSHPLSSFNDTHWDWAQGYKFFMTDGKIDSDDNGTPDQSYSYHIGNDDYLRTVSLSHNFAISEGTTTEINVLFDVSQIITDVDVNSDSFTHSTSNFPLVEKIADNYSSAFEIQ